MSKVIWKNNVPKEWVDYNGHMNDAAYAIAFSQSLDSLMDKIGIDASYRKEYKYTIFTLETHLLYKAEVHEGEELSINVSILDRDEKRLHLMFDMKNEKGESTATSEQMTIGIDQNTGKPAPFPEEITEKINQLPHLPNENWPKEAGRSIGIRKKTK